MANHAGHLDVDTIARLRSRLEQEARRLARLGAEADELAGSGTHKLMSDEPYDFADRALDLTTEDTAMALSENDRTLLAQVHHALQRLNDGTYGLSEVTGRPIPLERLEALPWATTNVDDPA